MKNIKTSPLSVGEIHILADGGFFDDLGIHLGKGLGCLDLTLFPLFGGELLFLRGALDKTH